MPPDGLGAIVAVKRRISMSAIDLTRRLELEELIRELRISARTIRALSVGEREVSCERLVAALRERLEAHSEHDDQGLQALGIWTDALERADLLEVDLLQELLYGIDALVRVHVWRETGVPLEPPEPRGPADV
jgi:hypothetical protein